MDLIINAILNKILIRIYQTKRRITEMLVVNDTAVLENCFTFIPRVDKWIKSERMGCLEYASREKSEILTRILNKNTWTWNRDSGRTRNKIPIKIKKFLSPFWIEEKSDRTSNSFVMEFSEQNKNIESTVRIYENEKMYGIGRYIYICILACSRNFLKPFVWIPTLKPSARPSSNLQPIVAAANKGGNWGGGDYWNGFRGIGRTILFFRTFTNGFLQMAY